MLAAHDVSGDAVFLSRAEELADRLMQAFNSTTGRLLRRCCHRCHHAAVDAHASYTTTTPGIPYNFVRLPTVHTGRTTAVGTASLAELGTFGLEFETLSKRTGRPEFAAASRLIYTTLNTSNPGMVMVPHMSSCTGIPTRDPSQGLLPVRINRRTGKAFSSRVQLTVGAMADSYYEYLLKTWLVTDKQDPLYLDMWIRAMDEMLDKLLFTSPSGDMVYLGEIKHTMYGFVLAVL